MITPGEIYLRYVGVPDDFPRWDTLARELDDAIMESAEQVIREWRDADPVLRAMVDGVAELWTWVQVPAGTLPLGTTIEVGGGGAERRGRLREPTAREREWYPNRLGVEWVTWSVTGGHPDVTPGTVVEAHVPVPLDLSACAAAKPGKE